MAQEVTKMYFGKNYVIDLSKYVSNEALTQTLAGYVTTGSLASELAAYTKTTDLEQNYVKYSNLDSQVSSLGYAKTTDVSAVDDKYKYLLDIVTKSATDGGAVIASATGMVTVDGALRINTSNGYKEVATKDMIVTPDTIDQTYNPDSAHAQSGKAVAQALGTITTISYQVVDTLPGTGEDKVIYLVPSDNPDTQNVKDEYMWINGAWEQIGSTAVDLSDYAKTTEMQSYVAEQLTPYAKSADVTTTVDNAIAPVTARVTTVEGKVTALEEASGTQSTDLANLTTIVNGHTEDIAALETSVGTNTNDIATLKTTTASQGTDIAALKTTTEGHTTAISNLQAADTTLSSRVSAIEGGYLKKSAVSQATWNSMEAQGTLDDNTIYIVDNTQA